MSIHPMAPRAQREVKKDTRAMHWIKAALYSGAITIGLWFWWRVICWALALIWPPLQ
jgi:hypothetical protein